MYHFNIVNNKNRKLKLDKTRDHAPLRLLILYYFMQLFYMNVICKLLISLSISVYSVLNSNFAVTDYIMVFKYTWKYSSERMFKRFCCYNIDLYITWRMFNCNSLRSIYNRDVFKLDRKWRFEAIMILNISNTNIKPQSSCTIISPLWEGFWEQTSKCLRLPL